MLKVDLLPLRETTERICISLGAGGSHLAFAFANADPSMLHLYAALAQKERRLIAKRTKAALSALKERG